MTHTQYLECLVSEEYLDSVFNCTVPYPYDVIVGQQDHSCFSVMDYPVHVKTESSVSSSIIAYARNNA